MEYLTGTILSGILYDSIKCGVLLSADNLKDKLRDWVIDEAVLLTIYHELNKLELTNDLSELAIENKVLASAELKNIIEKIQHTPNGNTIIQNHSGSGDNIGRNKIIQQGK